MSDWEIRCWRTFSADNFVLDHVNPELFVTSQWADQHTCWRHFYIVYRVFAVCFWIAALVMTGVTDHGSYQSSMGVRVWFTYFRHWAILLLAIDVTIQMATAVIAYKNSSAFRRPYPDGRMPPHLKLQWVISNAAIGAGLFASLTDTTIFYTGSFIQQPMDVFPLILNSVYLIFNLYISAMPIRVFHFLYPACYVIVYVVFSVIFQYSFSVAAHPLMDWGDPLFVSLYTVLGALVGVFAIWLVVYGLYRLRMLCAGEKGTKLDNNTQYNPYSSE